MLCCCCYLNNYIIFLYIWPFIIYLFFTFIRSPTVNKTVFSLFFLLLHNRKKHISVSLITFLSLLRNFKKKSLRITLQLGVALKPTKLGTVSKEATCKIIETPHVVAVKAPPITTRLFVFIWLVSSNESRQNHLVKSEMTEFRGIMYLQSTESGSIKRRHHPLADNREPAGTQNKWHKCPTGLSSLL